MNVAFLPEAACNKVLGRHSVSGVWGHCCFLSCTVQLRNDAWCWEDDTVYGREELGKLERKSNMSLISTHHCFVCPVLSKVLDSS